MELEEELIELHRTSREVAPFTGRYPGLTPAAGYAAARRLHEHRLVQGWKPVGRKIGFTNRSIWPRYGVYEPIWGMVYDRTLGFAERDRGAIPLEGLLNPRIEPEICFRLKSVPRAGDLRSLLESLDWVAHSIEIVQSRFPDWKFKLADCTAANGLHGRLMVGTPHPVRDLPRLAEALPLLSLELLKEGEIVDRGVGANVLDSPLLALGHLVEALARQPGAVPLAAGEIISTGTLTDAHPVRPGESWSTQLSGLPIAGLSVRFE